MAGHTVEESIKAVSRALRFGVSEIACKFDLVEDGFKPEKAAVIVRWALQSNKKKPSLPVKKKEAK
jgi:hypothetical protein